MLRVVTQLVTQLGQPAFDVVPRVLSLPGWGGPQNLYGMSPVNYYARCNPSPLAGVAQGVVKPGDTVPSGKRPPGQARGLGMPCPCPWYVAQHPQPAAWFSHSPRAIALRLWHNLGMQMHECRTCTLQGLPGVPDEWNEALGSVVNTQSAIRV